jgi:hypothetical protein
MLMETRKGNISNLKTRLKTHVPWLPVLIRKTRWVLRETKQILLYFWYISPPRSIDWIDATSSLKRWTGAISSLKQRKQEGNKILGILDFNRQSMALGDTIIFQEILLTMKEANDASTIEICIVEDLGLSSKNKLHKKKPNPKRELVLKTLDLNPFISRVYCFNKRSEYNQFRLRNLHRYRYFPNKRGQFTSDQRQLLSFMDRNGYLPRMKSTPESLGWARNLVKDKIYPAKLIVVQIRNQFKLKDSSEFAVKMKGAAGADLRNSNLTEWEKFFKSLDPSIFKVICICSKDEVVESWRNDGLVLFSKDFDSAFTGDCALINLSYISLFPPSGMFEFGFFSRTPSLVFNHPFGYWKKKGDPKYQLNGALGDEEQYPYQSQHQKIIWEKDTFEVIHRYFNQLNSALLTLEKGEESKVCLNQPNPSS